MYNRQLETFIAVADAGSFSKASEELYISPTAVIKQINLLEQSLELQLFVRTNRGLMITESGKSLYQDAKHLIQYSKDSITRAKNAMERTKNIIRIGTSQMTPGQFLVELWPKIHEMCPDIRFELVPFENTPENAREILKNLGQNIDIVAGIFDATLLEYRQCAGLMMKKEPIRVAVSVYHELAKKEKLSLEDMEGESLMLLKRGSFGNVDELRDDLRQNHPEIQIVDFDFYSLDAFNRCENSNNLLMAVDPWDTAHPLLKLIPVEWDYTIPYGLLHSPNPSPLVKRFLKAVSKLSQ